MSEQMSKNLLIVEAILIVAPLTFLASLETYLQVSSLIEFPSLFYVVALGLLASLNLMAIISVWRLFVAFFHGGRSELKNQHPVWWVIIFIGVIILLGAIISNLLPPSPEYSDWWSFREDFNLFAFSAPILIPMCHLAAERVLRRGNF